MNEYVLVEFIAGIPDESKKLIDMLRDLGEDFIYVGSDSSSESDEDGNHSEWITVRGKISSAYATVIKLQNPFLAERMRISYIPSELKDKYRR